MKLVSKPGDYLAEFQTRAFNRSGAAILKGQMAALNLDFANATYDEFAFETTDARRNAVAVTTANATRQVVVALEDIAIDAVGLWALEGLVQIFVNGGNQGEFIHATNAQVYATPLTLTELDALAVPTGINGFTLEDTSGSVLAWCHFCGYSWQHLLGGGADA